MAKSKKGFFENHQKYISGLSTKGSLMKNIILGGQDGLVNVLGVLLGVAVASQDVKITIIAGLAATFAESVSMGAVAYTSTKAAKEHYEGERERELKEIQTMPDIERMEVEHIYRRKGFKGKKLKEIVDHICSDEELWLDTMMAEELGLTEAKSLRPLYESLVVLFSALIGSFIPLIPFFFVPTFFTIPTAIALSVVFSGVVLFISGMLKGKFTSKKMFRSGLELTVIGIVSGFVGFLIGWILGT